jgi:putative IMPACT (imprinted ancient) family translation regulator
VKLGAGGLVRAYGGTAAACLRAAERIEMRPRVARTVRVPFAHTAALFPLLERFGAERGAETWGAEGLTLAVTMDAAQLDALARALRDATRGAATLE